MKFVTKQATPTDLRNLANNSACTMLGYIPDELHLYIETLEKQGFLKEEEIKVYTCSGSDLNTTFDIPDSDLFSDDLNVFIIDLDQMENIGGFAVSLRFQLGFRWLDDIISNRTHSEDFRN